VKSTRDGWTAIKIPPGLVIREFSAMKLEKPLAVACLIEFLAVLAGCGNDAPVPEPVENPMASASGENGRGPGPFGKPVASEMFAPFAGDWVFDFEQTLAAQKSAGASDQELEMLRKQHAQNPRVFDTHHDVTISGNEAVGSGVPSAEYRFFGMHKHGGKICGKAWHHEDRYDPGDMSKCYVRLWIADDRLHLEVRMGGEGPELDDPELRSSPAIEIDSADRCDADKPAHGQWSPWTHYVFTRRR
jgi:hypothetical protein